MAEPTSSTGLQSIEKSDAEFAPFPARNESATGLVNGTQTDVSSMFFADKIVVTITQAGRLSQWVQVPLQAASPTTLDTILSSNDDMLPMAHLSPKTLLGSGGDQRETIGHLYATQIASTISTRNPEETRTLMVGLGLQKLDMAREAFFDLIELLQKVI